MYKSQFLPRGGALAPLPDYVSIHKPLAISPTNNNSRLLRIDYQHRYKPNDIKKMLSAEDVILNRYKYIPPVTYPVLREPTRVITSNKTRTISSSSLKQVSSNVQLPPIEVKNGITGNLSDNNDNDKQHQSIRNDNGLNYDNSCNNSHRNLIPNERGSDSPSSLHSSYREHNSSTDSSERLKSNSDLAKDKKLTAQTDQLQDTNAAKDTGKDEESDESKEKLEKDENRELGTPDFDTDLDSTTNSDFEDTDRTKDHKKKRKLSKCLETYYQSCTKCRLAPNKSFARQCGRSTVDIRNRMLTHREARPIAIALVKDQRTSFLDISSNPLGPIGTNCLAQMLVHNNSLVELNMAGTFPRQAGLESLAYCLHHNKTLRRLYLDDNDIQPSEGTALATLIEKASYLSELHLGNNNVGFEGSDRIAAALAVATGRLAVLNLKYNNIRTNSAVRIAEALAKNKTLRTLDVSWNGFGQAGCKAVATALEKNTTLQHLNLTCNRLGLKSLDSVIQGITKNKGLLSINVSGNPLTTEGVKAIITALLATHTWTITELDLTGIPIDQEFLVLKTRLEQASPVKIRHDDVISLGTSDLGRAATGTFLDNYDPVLVMFEFMKKDNLRVIDLFQFFDIKKRDKLSKTDLSAGFKTLSVPFTEHQVDVIVKTLDKDRDGFVSLDEMVKGYNKNDKSVKTRRIKATRNKTKDQGLENLWAYLKILISKRKDENAKKMAINSQAKRSNFLLQTNGTPRK